MGGVVVGVHFLREMEQAAPSVDGLDTCPRAGRLSSGVGELNQGVGRTATGVWVAVASDRSVKSF